MAFQPSTTLKTRTFVGLIIAQFLAAFNDQAIHAAAMFFAINQQALTKKSAISLMPILFYAPWALFCTVAGYLADRYSKRQSLVFWKVAEVAVTLVALAGFWLGTRGHEAGPWVVLATVFLMGTHSAFFVPAKYGVMPEILQPHLLSKGNGILESLSFLAVILGTVTGGVLSYTFRGQEWVIGLILVGLALVGAAASLLIRRMPAANPTRHFPPYLYRPLWESLRTLWQSRPLRVAVLGIAFFTFMVAFMRATVYMHGESRVPRWTEFQTSLVVGMSALGIGLGSPLAGYLSGGKVELGLVPLGAVGMAAAAVMTAFYLDNVPALVAGIIAIGFFTGFFIVPLFTLLQHRAPRACKGDAVATSNFINVTGAMAASLLFYALVGLAHQSGVAPVVEQRDRWARGTLLRLDYDAHGRPAYFEVGDPGERPRRKGQPNSPEDTPPDLFAEEDEETAKKRPVILVDHAVRPAVSVGLQGQEKALDDPSRVVVSTYVIRGVKHYQVRLADEPLAAAYDDEGLPRLLFLGTAVITLFTLLVLCRQVPDFFVRSLLWLRTHGRYRLKVVGIHNLPSNGPVILATNCDRFHECMQVIAATDRYARFILFETPSDDGPRRPLLRYLARRVGLIVLRPDRFDERTWNKALTRAKQALANGELLGLTLESEAMPKEAQGFYQSIAACREAAVLPVYCGTSADPAGSGIIRKTRVVIGHPLRTGSPIEEVRHTIRVLADWVQSVGHSDAPLTTVQIPGAGDHRAGGAVEAPPAPR
jgi:MFS family permease